MKMIQALLAKIFAAQGSPQPELLAEKVLEALSRARYVRREHAVLWERDNLIYALRATHSSEAIAQRLGISVRTVRHVVRSEMLRRRSG